MRASCDWTRPIPPYLPIPKDVKSAGPDTPRRQPIFRKDLEVLDGTLAYLREKAAAEKKARRARGKTKTPAQPWAVCASFVLPHPPFKARRDILKTYTGTGDLPINPRGADRDACDRALQQYTGELGVKLTDAQIRRAREVYFALVTEFDEYAGRILDELDRLGLAENTVVFYFSDHGEMAGEHGLWSKVTLLESSVRVPLIVRWPGKTKAGARVHTPVSLVDLFPTFLDVARIAVPPAIPRPGRSLCDLFGGDPVDGGGGHFVFGEFEGEGWAHPRCFLRRGRYKLVYNHSADLRLYDLEKDPHEMHDLSAQPNLAQVKQAFLNYLSTFWEPRKIEAEVIASQTRRKIARCRNVGKDLGW